MEKIYGIYPGYLEKEGKLETVNNLKEYELFFLLRALHDVNFRILHSGDDVDISDNVYAIGYLKQLTTKFGVEMEKPEKGKNGNLRTKSYIKWYDFWYNHFENMSEDEYDEFINACNNNEDITKYLPKTRWNEEVEEKGSNHK